MADLKFTTKLKEKPVLLTGKGGKEQKYMLKELTGDQREEWNNQFDYTIEVIDGETKAKPGKDFKMPAAKSFLAMCFYDPDDKLVPADEIGKYPQTMLDELHLEGLKLSGMDPESIQKAKNALEAKGTSGTE
jgi:hypothetical protein